MNASPTDPRSPCIIGVASRTWHADEVGDVGAPEPLDMWVDVAAAATRDAHATGNTDVLAAIDSINVVYCQTCQYDDPPARLADRLGIAPVRRFYSGLGGTTSQQLVAAAAMSTSMIEIMYFVYG